MDSDDQKRLQAEFFKYENGTQPVRDWLLNELGDADRKLVGRDIAAVEFEWPVGPPLVKKYGEMWELRTVVSTGWSRLFFVIAAGRMILLHGVVKKSKNVSKDDQDTALKRLSLLRAERKGNK